MIDGSNGGISKVYPSCGVGRLEDNSDQPNFDLGVRGRAAYEASNGKFQRPLHGSMIYTDEMLEFLKAKMVANAEARENGRIFRSSSAGLSGNTGEEKPVIPKRAITGPETPMRKEREQQRYFFGTGTSMKGKGGDSESEGLKRTPSHFSLIIVSPKNEGAADALSCDSGSEGGSGEGGLGVYSSETARGRIRPDGVTVGEPKYTGDVPFSHKRLNKSLRGSEEVPDVTKADGTIPELTRDSLKADTKSDQNSCQTAIAVICCRVFCCCFPRKEGS